MLIELDPLLTNGINCTCSSFTPRVALRSDSSFGTEMQSRPGSPVLSRLVHGGRVRALESVAHSSGHSSSRAISILTLERGQREQTGSRALHVSRSGQDGPVECQSVRQINSLTIHHHQSRVLSFQLRSRMRHAIRLNGTQELPQCSLP